MLGCLCGGIIELALYTLVMIFGTSLSVDLWNKVRKRCYCKKVCCQKHGEKL